jgi:hypothetical protein
MRRASAIFSIWLCLFALGTPARMLAQGRILGPILLGAPAAAPGGAPVVTGYTSTACTGASTAVCTLSASVGDFVCAGGESGNSGPPTLTITDDSSVPHNTWTAMGVQNAASGFAVRGWCTKVAAAFTTFTIGGIDTFGRGAGTNWGTNPPSSSTSVATGTNVGNSVATDTVLTVSSFSVPANSLVVSLMWALGDGLTPTATGYKCGITSYVSGPCTVGANAFFMFIWKYESGTTTGSITASQTSAQVWSANTAAYQ